MEGEDIKRVMKWVGYVYIPVIIIFVAVYLLVQYRLREIEDLRAKADLPAQNATSSVSSMLAQ